MAVVGTIPVWLTGKNVSVVQIEYLTYDTSTGQLTDSGLVSLVGLIDEVTYSGSQTTENIAAMTSLYDNEVPIEVNDSITLTEILRTTAASSILAAAWQNAATPMADHARVKVTRGGNTWTFIGIMQSYSESIRKGKSVARMSLQMVDVGNATANPTYASP